MMRIKESFDCRAPSRAIAMISGAGDGSGMTEKEATEAARWLHFWTARAQHSGCRLAVEVLDDEPHFYASQDFGETAPCNIVRINFF